MAMGSFFQRVCDSTVSDVDTTLPNPELVQAVANTAALAAAPESVSACVRDGVPCLQTSYSEIGDVLIAPVDGDVDYPTWRTDSRESGLNQRVASVLDHIRFTSAANALSAVEGVDHMMSSGYSAAEIMNVLRKLNK